VTSERDGSAALGFNNLLRDGAMNGRINNGVLILTITAACLIGSPVPARAQFPPGARIDFGQQQVGTAGGEITVAQVPHYPGSVGTIAFSVSGDFRRGGQGATATALQFDVLYESSLPTPTVSAGAVATAAGKTVSGRVLVDGRMRILVTGPNQTAIADGQVVVLVIQVTSAPSGWSYPLAISNATAVDALGQAIAVAARGAESQWTRTPTAFPIFGRTGSAWISVRRRAWTAPTAIQTATDKRTRRNWPSAHTRAVSTSALSRRVRSIHSSIHVLPSST
jgi:hypothetical protein